MESYGSYFTDDDDLISILKKEILFKFNENKTNRPYNSCEGNSERIVCFCHFHIKILAKVKINAGPIALNKIYFYRQIHFLVIQYELIQS
jgi:hypothetical protein